MVVDTDCLPLLYTVRARAKGASTAVSLSSVDADGIWPILYSSTAASSTELLLPVGSADHNYTVELLIQIADTYGTYAEQPVIEVQVYPYDAASSSELAATLEGLTDTMVTEASTGYTDQATRYARVISDIINTDSTSGQNNVNVSTGTKIGIREQVVTILVPAASTSLTIDDVDQISSVLDLVTDVPAEVSSTAQEGALGATERLTGTLEEIQEEDETAVERLQISASLLLKICDNVVDAAIDTLETDETYDARIVELRNAAVESTLSRSVSVVDKVTEVLSKNVIAGEGAITVDAGNIRVKVQKTDTQEVEGNFEVEPGCNLDFPPADSLFDVSSQSSAVQFKAVMYQPNMRPFAAGAGGINSKTVSFEFLDTSTNQPIEVQNTAKPITITIPRVRAPSITLENETTVSFGQTYAVGGPISVHTVDVPNHSGADFEGYCLGFDGMEANYTYNCTLLLMLTTSGLPEIDSNSWNCTLAQTVTLRNSSDTMATLDFGDPWNISNSVVVEGDTKCFVDNVIMSTLLEDGVHSAIKVGVRGLMDEAEWNLTYARLPNATFNQKRYAFKPTLHRCSYIKEKDERMAWKQDGCQVSAASTASQTVCLCNHLTMFGAGFEIPMNRIDLSQSAFTKLDENPVVFAFMTCCLCLYLVLVMWARKVDQRDLLKMGVTPLPDNRPRDRFHYEITVLTGTKAESGTTARVSIIITGEQGDSGPRLLCDPKRPVLKRGGVDSFLLTTSRPFGDLLHVRVWHDNGGRSPSWFLGHLSVKDLGSGKMFYFMANRWWAVEEDDGMIDRVIPVAGKGELTSFSHLFTTKTRKNLSDGHLWFSVFNRPVKSRFTRVQRVSCCLSLLFSAMMANIFFYKVDFTGGGQQLAYEIGPISFTMSEVVIGVISSLMVFPANIIIVQIFRLSKAPPRNGKICCSKKEHETSSAPRKSMSSSHTSLTSSVGSKELRQQLDLLERGQSPTPVPTLSSRVQPLGISRVSSPSEIQLDHSAIPRSYSLESTIADGASPTLTSFPRIPPLTTNPGYNTARPAPPKRKKKKKKRFELPWQCLYLGWALLIGSVGVAFWLTIEVAGQFGKTKATEWLVSMCISLVQDIFFTQPVKVLFLAFFLSLLFKKPETEDDGGDDEDIPPLGQDEEWLHDRGPKDPSQGLPPGVVPPDPEELAAARELRFKQIKMKSIIREIIFYILFLNVVMLIAFGDRDPQAFLVNKSMKDTFVEAHYHGRMKFSKIKTREDFWNYTENVFIPSLFSETWYTGAEDVVGIKQNLVPDKHMTLVGSARLRQLRVVQDPCILPDLIEKANVQCKRTYSFDNDEDRDYAPGWAAVNASDPPDYFVQENLVWRHYDWTELDSFPYLGKLATYKGGGYLAQVDRNEEKALAHMQYLRDMLWVDQFTRGVFFEFVTYNPAINMFCISFLLVEFPSQGGAFPYVSFRTIRLDRYQGSFAYFVLAGEVTYLLFLLFFTYREVRHAWKQRKAYLRSLWNLLEVATLVLAYCTVTFYLYRLFVGRQLVAQYREDPDSFMNFQFVSHWDLLYRYLTAMVVFVANVKFLKLLRFNRRLLILSMTLKSAGHDILHYLVVFGIVFAAFSLMAYSMYTGYLVEFSTYGSTVETLFSTLLGKFKFNDMMQASRYLGPLFFFFYVVIIMFICLNMFLSIINEAFAKVRQENARLDNELEIVNFMMSTFRKWVGATGSSKGQAEEGGRGGGAKGRRGKGRKENEEPILYCIDDDDPVEIGCQEMERKTQEMMLKLESYLQENLSVEDVKLSKRKIIMSG